MPTNKDFKRLVRARMEKTGEAYTAARANLLKRSTPLDVARDGPGEPVTVDRLDGGRGFSPGRPGGPSGPGATDHATRAGMSDAAIKKATGCTWEKWVQALDYSGADQWSHRAIADYVRNTWKVNSWWAQSVTVGYERIKGLRAIGQRRDGGYEATKTKTLNASAAAVFRAFTHKRLLKRWLPGVNLDVRTATPNRSIRMNWDDGTSVEVWLTSKGRKTSAAVTHRKLTGKEDVDRRKAFWTGRLEALAQVVGQSN